jgi:signal peptidase I
MVNFLRWIALGDWPEGGQCLMRGDHVFVDRFSYHFRRPQRGEVIVFDTHNIAELSASSRGKFYIKRLIALENDEVRITPPCVRVNGQILDDRPAFRRIYSLAGGYNGYVLPTPDQFPPGRFVDWFNRAYTVPRQHLFVLGDNSRRSLDGRYWGSVPKSDLVGRAVFVYWPIIANSDQRRRFGFID